MVNDVYTTASRCSACVRNRLKPKLKKQLQLNSASSPLELVIVNIFESLPHSANGNEYVIVVIDRFSKLSQLLQTVKTSSAYVANLFLDWWIACHGISAYVLTNNEVHFTSKLLQRCTMVGMKHLTATAYYSQSSRQVERYSCIIVKN